VPFCFAQLSSNAIVDRAVINRAAGGNALASMVSHVFFFAEISGMALSSMRACGARSGRRRGSRDRQRLAALVGAMASTHDVGGPAYRLSIQQGVSMGRRSEMEAQARQSDGGVTSVSVGGATAYVASGEIDVPPRRSSLSPSRCLPVAVL